MGTMTAQPPRSPALAQLAALVAGRVDPRSLSSHEAQAVVQLAPRHGLAPMLSWAIEQAGLDPAAPPWTSLAAAQGQWRLGYLLKTSAHTAVQAAFAAAGIPAIWLKGFALAHTVYPQPLLRPMGDLDVLVPYEQRHAALAAAESLGYHKHLYEPELFADYDELRHHYHLRGHVEDLVALELHFRLLMGDKLLPPPEMDWFWQQSRPVVWKDLAFSALSPAAQLLYVSAHAIIHHGEIQFYLQRYFDLHMLVSRTPGLDWELVLQRAVALRWTYALERALGYTRQYFDTPLPAGVLSELRQMRPPDEDVAYAQRQKSDFVDEFLHQLRVQGRASVVPLALKTIFPSPDYMRFFYHTAATWGLFPYYVLRLTYFVKEIARRQGRPRGR